MCTVHWRPAISWTLVLVMFSSFMLGFVTTKCFIILFVERGVCSCTELFLNVRVFCYSGTAFAIVISLVCIGLLLLMP